MVQCSDSVVMSTSMTNRPKPVSVVRTMTERLNENTVHLATWTL